MTKIKSAFFVILFLPFAGALIAQTAQDVTVPLTVSIATDPASVTLNWPNPEASNLIIQRRTKGQAGNQWIQLLNVTGSLQTSLTDNSVAAEQTYEYVVQRTTTINAYGYAHVALEAPATDDRGKLLLFVDADITGPLAPELERLRDDLIGDGWQIIGHSVDASATVQSIKNQIIADYNADPANVKSVFLLGKIPVPYSGNSAWDGHPDHQGAWPADVYYAEVNGAWSDFNVNNTTPSRSANDNVPLDGKFDQSYVPSPVELQVGRVDFRRLTQGTFGATTVELLKRYLDKNHNWRTAAYTVENKAIVDDNFGYFNGEAFAGNGFRKSYPLVGPANIVAGDFFDNTNPQRYLIGYGCGGGNYNGAGGVGNSANFANDTVHVVFSNLFGSYHGDWDYETNPFMPSALASRGGILTCSWAGRPHHFYQALASGETIGYCMKETQNAQYNNGFFGSFGESGAHVALLGDPTLRAFVVAPPSDVAAVASCNDVLLNWTASPDTAIAGYHVYRSFAKNGAYNRLTTNAISGMTFTDTNPPDDTLYYQVRAVKMQTSPGGGAFVNNSTGIVTSLVFVRPPEVEISSDIGILTCIDTLMTLSPVSTPAGVSFQWSGPDNFFAVDQNVTINTPGIYAVTVTFADGCTSTQTASIVQDAVPPTISAFSSGTITCSYPTIILEGGPGIPEWFYMWNGPCIPGGAQNQPVLEVTCPGVYFLTVINSFNGCSSTASVTVTQNIAVLTATSSTTDESAPGANDGTATIVVTGGSGNYIYQWSTGQSTSTIANLAGGTYTVTVTDVQNGCTVTDTIVINTLVGTQEAELFKTLLLSPNPTGGPATLFIRLHHAAAVKVSVHDASGRLLLETPEKNLTEVRIPFDLNKSPAGIYTVSVFIENQVVVRKLVVLR